MVDKKLSDYTHLRNYTDHQRIDGMWLKSLRVADKTYAKTRAYTVWYGFQTRCRTLGSINKFLDFQEFANWCQFQYGYLEKEPNGSYWGLDKDILSGSQRVYSPATCLFVPQCINTLFKQTSLGEDGCLQPKGVNYCKDLGKYKVNHTPYGDSKTHHVAVCDTHEEGLVIAAKVWVAKVRNYMADTRIVKHVQLVEALELKTKLMEKYYA